MKRSVSLRDNDVLRALSSLAQERGELRLPDWKTCLLKRTREGASERASQMPLWPRERDIVPVRHVSAAVTRSALKLIFAKEARNRCCDRRRLLISWSIRNNFLRESQIAVGNVGSFGEKIATVSRIILGYDVASSWYTVEISKRAVKELYVFAHTWNRRNRFYVETIKDRAMAFRRFNELYF